MNKNQQYIVKLSPRQRVHLHNITKKGEHKARVIIRARVLLESATGLSAVAVAVRVGTSDRTVERIRARFGDGDLHRALYDADRPGAPVKIDDAIEAHIVATACSTPPKGQERWTLLLLQENLKRQKRKKVSTVAIWHHLNDRDIKPWREKNVVHSSAHARIH